MVDRARQAAPAARQWRRREAASLGHALDHAPQTRIVDVPEAERERVLLRGDGELVHERLDREHVLRRGERSEVRGAQTGRLDVQRHIGRADRVGRDRVPPGGDPEHLRIKPGGGVHVGVLVVAPRDDAPVDVETGPDLEHRLRPRR